LELHETSIFCVTSTKISTNPAQILITNFHYARVTAVDITVNTYFLIVLTFNCQS